MKAGKRYQVQISPVFHNKTIQTYGSLGLSIAAVIIFGVFAIKPTIENILSLQHQIDTQNKTLKALQEKSDKLAQAVNNYHSIPDETKLKLFTLLPNTPNSTCLIDLLNTQAGNGKVTVAGLQVQPFDLKGKTKCSPSNTDLADIEKNNSVGSSLKEVPFTINTTTTYPSLTSFLNSLNSSIRLISIDSAFYNKNVDSPLILSISGKAYYYK